jgi:hypothetical protein
MCVYECQSVSVFVSARPCLEYTCIIHTHIHTQGNRTESSYNPLDDDSRLEMEAVAKPFCDVLMRETRRCFEVSG